MNVANYEFLGVLQLIVGQICCSVHAKVYDTFLFNIVLSIHEIMKEPLSCTEKANEERKHFPLFDNTIVRACYE